MMPLTGLSTGAINGLLGGADMSVKFSEDIVPLSDMKINPGKIVKRTNESHRPVLLTSRGRGVAVMQSLDDFEKAEEEKTFMRAVVEGLNDLDNKREISLEAAKARLEVRDVVDILISPRPEWMMADG
jgi:prevent-host-death family protein